MGKFVRVITKDGAVLASGINSTDIVNEIEKIHSTSAVVTAALGRLATGAVLISSMMKEEGSSVTLRINGGGPAGSLIAVAGSDCSVKAYVQNPVVEIPLNSKGKLDVGAAVGTDGLLSVIRDSGDKEPHTGYCNIATGEIGDDITSYFAVSEQIPTVCALGVLVNPDLSCKAAGGIFIQLLPGADDSTIDKLESSIAGMRSVSAMAESGLSPMDMLEEALKGFELEIIDEGEAHYRCDCSSQRVERALASLGAQELQKMIDEEEEISVQCHFCNKEYTFSKEKLKFLKKMQKKD